MQEFFEIVFSFPTVAYTVLLGVAIVFSALMIVGGVGFETLDLEFDFEGGAEDAGSAFELLSSFGLGTVPMSIFATTLVFAGWSICFLLVYSVQEFVMDVGIGIGSLLLVAATVFAFPITSFLLAPLRMLTAGEQGERWGEHLVGTVCEVTTSRVDESFGRAECFVHGSSLVLEVRCSHDNDLSRGDRALIIGFDDGSDNYEIEPYDALVEDRNPEIDLDGTALEDIEFEKLEEAAEEHEEQKATVEQF